MRCASKAPAAHHLRFLAALSGLLFLGACAHPITINPTMPAMPPAENYSAKTAGYVLTEQQRATEVITPGGGGDKVSYYPYRDLEKGLRDALRSLYVDVVNLRSAMDYAAVNREGVKLVFSPAIRTTSSSDSFLTWPPTQFSVVITTRVTDMAGNTLGDFEVEGQGEATFSEFTADFGLAGRRATQQALERFVQAIRERPELR